jgi:DNA-binding transcriptional regulator YdaS (Cro superfamily)
MLKDEVIARFKSPAGVAAALAISEAAVSQWGEIVPWGPALEIEHLTNGEIPVDHSVYREINRKTRRKLSVALKRHFRRKK